MKHSTVKQSRATFNQPPSGGCVLKQSNHGAGSDSIHPAAFGRLCVETNKFVSVIAWSNPAAFGRLCVETSIAFSIFTMILNQPPSGGCVLKHQSWFTPNKQHCQPPSGGCVLKPTFGRWVFVRGTPSRLRAAVC